MSSAPHRQRWPNPSDPFPALPMMCTCVGVCVCVWFPLESALLCKCIWFISNSYSSWLTINQHTFSWHATSAFAYRQPALLQLPWQSATPVQDDTRVWKLLHYTLQFISVKVSRAQYRELRVKLPLLLHLTCSLNRKSFWVEEALKEEPKNKEVQTRVGRSLRWQWQLSSQVKVRRKIW